MEHRSIQRNKRFLSDLFAGPFRGHALIMNHETIPPPTDLGDFTLSEQPVHKWLDWAVGNYRASVERHLALDDDAVPFVNLHTNTGVFAAAFGCKVHVFENSPAAAMHCVTTAAEAGRLPIPDFQKAPTLARCFELAELVRRELGPTVPISTPDIQSPFDIAALIWKKEPLFMAMLDDPDAVKRLVQKCHILLRDFLIAFKKEFSGCNLVHCPNAWAPADLGCSLSEDEAGSLSVEMFEEFCLPGLIDLSNTFGGLFMHCCATADHQYASFKKIPNLRGLNRVFQEPGPRPAIEAFSGRTVLMMAWIPEQQVCDLLAMARPDTRFLFNMSAQPLDDARATYERLRARCPRLV